jgi:hypothetical protein
MTTKTTHPTFKASSTQTELPVYKHSDVDEFIRVEDFDLFEMMLWHQNAARDTGNTKAEELRRNGVQSLRNSPHADAATKCRSHFERLQEAFDSLLSLKEQEKLARQNRGQAKGRLIPGWQDFVANAGKGSSKKVDPAHADTTRSSLERLHSYKVATTSCDVIAMMMRPAWQRLNLAQKELSRRLYLIHSTAVKEMAMNNILCARQLLLSQEPATTDVAEQRESSTLSCATSFLISDQWDADESGAKLRGGDSSHAEERTVGWGNMPSPVDY